MIEACPHCRAVVSKSDVLSTSWLSVHFACGSWDYFNGDESLQCGKRSLECRKATNTSDEPSEMGKESPYGRRRKYRRWMTDDRGIDVS